MVNRVLAIGAVSALVFCGESSRGAPAVFSDISLDEAVARTTEDGTLLIIDFTAEWCAPCKQMDKTTWVDEKVVAWIDEHGVALQIDVDKKRAIANKFQVRSMPLMVVVKEGEEYDRASGYRTGPELIAWLDDVKAGKREVDRLREAAEADGDNGAIDVQAKMQFAQKLVMTGRFDEALEEYVWLWENMLDHEMGMYGVRLSFFVGYVERLVMVHEPARTRFTALRDVLTERVNQPIVNMEQFVDWVALNRMIGDTDATIRWYAEHKNDPKARYLVDRVQHNLERLFIEGRRWEDLLELHPDPASVLEMQIQRDEEIDRMMKEHRRDEGLDAAQVARMKEGQRRFRRMEIATFYGAALAVGKPEAASRLVDLAFRFDESSEMVFDLVEAALDVDEARPDHLDWLEQRLNTDQDTRRANRLRSRVERSLEAHLEDLD